MQDSRHNVRGRDIIKCHSHMYYKTILHASNCFNAKSISIFPDRGCSFDWADLELIITRTPAARLTRRDKHQSTDSISNFLAAPFIPVNRVEEIDDEDNPLIQLADHFAGLGVFSRGKHEFFGRWFKPLTRTETLFAGLRPPDNLPRSFVPRFRLIKNIYEVCNNNGVIISLKTNNYLRTYDPNVKLNFWHYVPAGPDDKGPIKNKKRFTAPRFR